MSHDKKDFSSQYTNANLAVNAVPYDSTILCDVVKHIEVADRGSIKDVASQIVAVILCAQRRGDSVPKLFRDLTVQRNDEETKELFYSFKHAINLTWAFIGLPHCIPACLGLVNEMRERGIVVSSEMDRPALQEADWLAEGKETNRQIYRAVGNSEVGKMVGESFPEISYIANAAVFGFLIGGSKHVQTLQLSEIIVASAIAGIGATRQARSHFKGAMGLGISEKAAEAVLEGVYQVAAWNRTTLPGGIEVSALAEEAQKNLKAVEEP